MPRRIGRSERYTFTERAQESLALAHRVAQERGDPYVGTEHLLLGLLADPQGIVSYTIALRSFDGLERVVEALRSALPPAIPSAEGAAPRQSPRVRKVIELAIREAAARGAEHVDTPHLFAGLCDYEEGIAARVLAAVELDGYALRRMRAFGWRPRTPTKLFRPEVDSSSDEPIYEQIQNQVKEAVATGLLRPGELLAGIRSLAAELRVAPGTVARAYRNLEALGVVRTESGLGTHVAPRDTFDMSPESRAEKLVSLLRPVAVTAHHLGADREELENALAEAASGIFEGRPTEGGSAGSGGRLGD